MDNNIISMKKAEEKLYLASFVGNDLDLFDQFLYIVGKDKGARYKAGKWLLSQSTINNILATIPEKNLSVEQPELIDLASYSDIGSTLKLSLYPYQKDIVEYCVKNKKAIIVAPCGCGKSAIGIDIFVDARRYNVISSDAKGLIVVKTSLKLQWEKEVEKFSDLTPKVIDTFKGSTSSIQNKIRRLKKKVEPLLKDAIGNIREISEIDKQIEDLEKESETVFNEMFSDKYDLYIVNYETLRDEKVRKALHKKKNLEYIFCDECQMCKSDTSRRTKALWEFGDIKLRFGATATPIQKNPMDVYSLAKYVSPDTWKTKSSFASRYVNYSGFGRISGSKNEKELNQKLSEFMIIKTKEEVSKQLPSLIPITRYCELDEAQIEMTETLLDEIQQFKEQEKNLLQKNNDISPDNEELLKIQANIMARQTFASELATSEELLTLSDSDLAKRYVTGSKSHKIELMLELLDEIIDSGEKVAIFSKYQKLQDILRREILKKFPNIKVAAGHGGLNSEQRYEECYTKFQDNDDYKVLLLTDAFCEGVNLRKAKYLIEMEPADSYLVQTQRRGRIERADSIHDTVFVYQLVAEKSYDEIGVKIVEKKERYDSQIIKGNL